MEKLHEPPGSFIAESHMKYLAIYNLIAERSERG